MSLRLGLLRVVERGEKLVRSRLHGLELLLSLLAHLGHEREAILRAHLADGVAIDALTRRLHRGRRVLERLGVFGPGRLLRGRDAELGLQRIDLRRIELRQTRAAMHAAGPSDRRMPGPIWPCIPGPIWPCIRRTHLAVHALTHAMHSDPGP